MTPGGQRIVGGWGYRQKAQKEVDYWNHRWKEVTRESYIPEAIPEPGSRGNWESLSSKAFYSINPDQQQQQQQQMWGSNIKEQQPTSSTTLLRRRRRSSQGFSSESPYVTGTFDDDDDDDGDEEERLLEEELGIRRKRRMSDRDADDDEFHPPVEDEDEDDRTFTTGQLRKHAKFDDDFDVKYPYKIGPSASSQKPFKRQKLLGEYPMTSKRGPGRPAKHSAGGHVVLGGLVKRAPPIGSYSSSTFTAPPPPPSSHHHSMVIGGIVKKGTGRRSKSASYQQSAVVMGTTNKLSGHLAPSRPKTSLSTIALDKGNNMKLIIKTPKGKGTKRGRKPNKVNQQRQLQQQQQQQQQQQHITGDGQSLILPVLKVPRFNDTLSTLMTPADYYWDARKQQFKQEVRQNLKETPPTSIADSAMNGKDHFVAEDRQEAETDAEDDNDDNEYYDEGEAHDEEFRQQQQQQQQLQESSLNTSAISQPATGTAEGASLFNEDSMGALLSVLKKEDPTLETFNEQQQQPQIHSKQAPTTTITSSKKIEVSGIRVDNVNPLKLVLSKKTNQYTTKQQ